MSPNDVNQRTDITVLDFVVKKLEEDVNNPSESPAASSHSEHTTGHRDDTYQQTIKESHATEHGVVTIPVAVLASLKRQLDSVQASIADLERYAAQVESRHRVDLEHCISERSERARLEKALADEKRKTKELSKSRFERDLEEIDKAIEALDVAWGKMQNNS
jgi:DNA primase